MKEEKITLFFCQEKSDKVYKAALKKKDGAFIVNFAYGRRGATLKTGTKTQSPVSYAKAKKIYDKLVVSKSAKGYTPAQANTTYVYSDDKVKTGIHCQLLNPIEASELEVLIEQEDWCGQEKMDGKRMLLQKGDNLIAINRKGFSVGAPKAILDTAKLIPNSFIMDGEAIGEVFYVFDLLTLDGVDLKKKPYSERYALLNSLNFSDAIVKVPSATTKESKKAQFNQLKANLAEGVVYKRLTAPYQAGRPNSGGDQLKFKFYATASVIVSKINNKRSVGMSIYQDLEVVFIGNVTIAPNKDIPALGSVIEVRYLYAYKGGSLFQPTFLMIRDDLSKTECLISQLKYKTEG